MAYSKLGRVSFATSRGLLTNSCKAISRELTGVAAEADSDGAPVPAWQYWKLKVEVERSKVEVERSKAEVERSKAEVERAHSKAKVCRSERDHWRWRCDADAKDYMASIREARLEILQHKYQLKARGIPELFIKALTKDAHMHCHTKLQDKQLREEDRKFYKDFAINWFPQARKEIWRIVLEMPTMRDFKEDMQKVLSSQDLDLLVMKATSFHKEFHHFHHSGMRHREAIIFVREHIRQGIQDASVDPLHLEGFLQAMAKKINVTVLFVDAMDVTGGADE